MDVENIYDKVPVINCNGKCINSCGPIHISNKEMKHIRQYCADNGVKFHILPETVDLKKLILDHKKGRTKFCYYLVDNKCSIYEARPLICRLWGTCESMPCEHGCEVKGDILTNEQCRELVAEAR